MKITKIRKLPPGRTVRMHNLSRPALPAKIPVYTPFSARTISPRFPLGEATVSARGRTMRAISPGLASSR